MGKYRKVAEKKSLQIRIGVIAVKAVLLPTTTHTWIDPEKIPATGGCILALNHVTQLDPLTAGHLVWDWGRTPRFMAKASLFRKGFLGWFMKGAGQIPVQRGGAAAVGSLREAVESVKDGNAVVVFPEGSVTKDPNLWPMVGKTGAARIALETGTPVIPIGQWGAHVLLPPYGRPNLRGGRKLIRMKVGDPVDLDDLRGQPLTHTVVAEATTRIMKAVTALVAELRQETAPDDLFDPKKAGVNETGKPTERSVEQPPEAASVETTPGTGDDA